MTSTPDPNKERNDPMVPEFWRLGEDFQDAIRNAGYDAETVEGIAVDVHDLLQSAERIREILEAASVKGRDDVRQLLRELAFEFDHIRWHCEAAVEYLDAASHRLAKGV